MRNRNGIFWGLFLLLSAIILVGSQLHLITYQFSFWTLVATIFLVAVLIKSLVYFAIPGTVFSLAFLGILYAKPLGITAIVPWTLLGAALLVSIGLSLIFRPLLAKRRPWLRKYYHYDWHNKVDYNGPDVETIEDPDVTVSVNMGNSIRYVESSDFKSANVSVNMGSEKVYFENVTVKDTANIHVDVSLGSLELFLPQNWNIVDGINNHMSNISEVGVRRLDVNSPTVTISGLVSLGNLKINYI